MRRFVVSSLFACFAIACYATPPKELSEGGVDVCPPGTVGCIPRPPANTSGNESVVAVFALNAFGFEGATKDVGLNLDGITTSPATPGNGCQTPDGIKRAAD